MTSTTINAKVAKVNALLGVCMLSLCCAVISVQAATDTSQPTGSTAAATRAAANPNMKNDGTAATKDMDAKRDGDTSACENMSGNAMEACEEKAKSDREGAEAEAKDNGAGVDVGADTTGSSSGTTSGQSGSTSNN